MRAIVVLLASAALVSAVGYGSSQFLLPGEDAVTSNLSTHRVSRSDLVITVTEDGNLESASNIDVKCQVAGGSSILWIVPDGSVVQKGDKLVELDAAAIEDQINTQKITFNKAKSAVIQAEKNYEVAQIAVKEYLEGTYLQELEAAETQITIAEENLRSAKNSLEYSKRMFQRGYISELELESQQFSVKRAELELNSAKTAKRVLEEFTKVKMVEDLQSQVETARAAMEAEQAAFELEEAKLRRLETQLANCVIYAPQDGMVVYANEMGGRGQQQVTVEEGAAVRDRQTILRLPDLSQMQVKVKVHETKVEDLELNMRARINVQGRQLQGHITSIANQPEATSFFQGNVKEYATIVRIEGDPGGLRPGMTAEVEILVAHLTDVLTVPVSSVVEQRGEFFCWVKGSNGKVERRKLTLGRTNDQFVQIVDGVAEGDEVVRNPRSVIEEARQQRLGEQEQMDVAERFGAGGPTENGGLGPGMSRGDGAGEGGGPARPGGAGPGEGPGPQFGPRSGDGDGQGGPGRGRRGGRGRGGGPGFDWTQLDGDGDGRISRDEAPERMQDFFDRLDENGDGFIDTEEIEAMRIRFGGRAAGGGAE